MVLWLWRSNFPANYQSSTLSSDYLANSHSDAVLLHLRFDRGSGLNEKA